MAQGNNAKRQGSNSHELYVLQALNRIVNALPASSTGNATEATLISVLNAIIASDQDIEVLLVRDTGNSDVVIKQVTDYGSGTGVITYEDVNGNPYVVVGPLVYLDPAAVLNLILAELQLLNTTDFATTANQSLAITELQSIVTNTTSIATEATLQTVATNTTGVARTPGIIRPNNVIGNLNTVVATFYSVSIANVGAANGTVLSAVIKPGEILNFSADAVNNFFTSFAYDATGTEFIIIYVA